MIFSTPSKKQFLLSLVCGLFISFASSADFGVANWGMTAEQIKNLESRTNLTPFGETNYLIYAIELGAIQKARLVYQLEQGILTEGRFLFYTSNPRDARTAIHQYNQIKALLSDQYGPPNVDQIIPKGTSPMMLDPAQYANELVSDRLILKSQWRSPTALLYHQLAWNGNKLHHQVHYKPSSTVTNQATMNDFGM